MYMTMKLLNEWHKAKTADDPKGSKIEKLIKKCSLAQQAQLIKISETYINGEVKPPAYLADPENNEYRESENKRAADSVAALDCDKHRKELYLLQLYEYANTEERVAE